MAPGRSPKLPPLVHRSRPLSVDPGAFTQGLVYPATAYESTGQWRIDAAQSGDLQGRCSKEGARARYFERARRAAGLLYQLTGTKDRLYCAIEDFQPVGSSPPNRG